MHSRGFTVVVTAVILLTAGDALAVGSMQRPSVKDLASSFRLASRSYISPSEILQGCGSHRHYDPVTQTCRGPADF